MCLVAHHEQETNWDSGGIHISGAQCQQVQKLVDKVAMRTHFHRGGWELWCDIALILLPFWGINTSCIMSHRYIHSTRESISLVLKYLIWKTFDLIIIWIFYKLKACISIPSRFVLFFFVCQLDCLKCHTSTCVQCWAGLVKERRTQGRPKKGDGLPKTEGSSGTKPHESKESHKRDANCDLVSHTT